MFWQRVLFWVFIRHGSFPGIVLESVARDLGPVSPQLWHETSFGWKQPGTFSQRGALSGELVVCWCPRGGVIGLQATTGSFEVVTGSSPLQRLSQPCDSLRWFPGQRVVAGLMGTAVP